jgi:hypothetical protein
MLVAKKKVLALDDVKFAREVNAPPDEYLVDTFPDHIFIIVQSQCWPIPRGPNTIFVFDTNENLVELPGKKELEKFFQSNVREGASPDKVVRAWLRLRMVYRKDEYLEFKYPDKTKSAGNTVSAVVEVVSKDDEGSFEAVLWFDDDGKFSQVNEERDSIRVWPRPICQAKLLTYPDALVRATAEHSLLVMGSRAKPYLLEQRANARADLRREIDRVLKRIELEGR